MGVAKMEEDLLVCFREVKLREFRNTGTYSVVSQWVSNWKYMSEKAFNCWKNVILKKCNWEYRIDIVMIKNETVNVYEWAGYRGIEEYQMAEIPSWCKELTF